MRNKIHTLEIIDTFSERLKSVMKSFKIKNTDIAKAMGKDNQIISNYFHGSTKPAWTDVCNLITYLQSRIGNFDLNYLFGNSLNIDLTNKMQRLQVEFIKLKTAYDQLTTEYVLLKGKNQTKER